jgi:heat shock protein HslJ
VRRRGALVAALVLLAACARDEPPVAPPPLPAAAAPARIVPIAEVEGRTWRLVALEPAGAGPAWSGLGVDLALDGQGLAAGHAGCNRWGAGYLSTRPGALSFEPPVSTRMFCVEPDGVMEREAGFLAALPRVRGYRLEGERLVLELDGGRMVLAADDA